MRILGPREGRKSKTSVSFHAEYARVRAATASGICYPTRTVRFAADGSKDGAEHCSKIIIAMLSRRQQTCGSDESHGSHIFLKFLAVDIR
jgi:hypothetical protein